MASILIPPDTPPPLAPREDAQLALWETAPADLAVTPHLLLQLEDDLESSRMREAFWISVVVHLMVVIFLAMSPKIFPAMMKGVILTTPEDLMRNQQMTYLDLPPDMQKAPKVAPKTDVLSDKNRIAQSQHPSIDKKTLEELKRAGPPKAPSAPAQQASASPPPQPAQPAQQQQPNGQQSQQTAQLQPANPQDNPRMPQQQAAAKFPGNFGGVMSPGSSIEQAARAVASRRGGGSYGGGGDYGMGPGGSAMKMGPLEILSDTQGVDFGPYLDRVLQAVRMNWYAIIPEEARPPLMKKGKVAIEFVILKDGKIAGMNLRAGSGDTALDRAAWGGITASVPFAPLPGEFHGPYLALR